MDGLINKISRRMFLDYPLESPHYLGNVYPDYLLTAKGLIRMILNAVLLRQKRVKLLPCLG